jgi:L-iditol 2-dehydrogenase
MKALLLSAYNRLEIADHPAPAPGPGEVLIRVRACGICGSDVHGYDGASGRRIPPLIMGHEAAGEIAALGAGAEGFRAGDRVTLDSMVSCGRCGYCRRGQMNLCDARQVLGVSCGDYRRHGAFAEYVSVPAHIVYHLPATVSFEQAAMIEPLSVAVHAVNRTPVKLGDTALVVGAGMIGLLAMQCLRLAGCARVIIVDIDDSRLDLARRLGASEAVNARGFEAASCQADVAVEAVGASQPLQTAIAGVRKGGAVTMIGNVSPSVDLPLQSVVTRELSLIGTCASSGEYPACIELLARGAVRVDPIITALAPLEEGAAWFARLHRREPNLLKVVLQP